jgi:hypothetical protein
LPSASAGVMCGDWSAKPHYGCRCIGTRNECSASPIRTRQTQVGLF